MRGQKGKGTGPVTLIRASDSEHDHGITTPIIMTDTHSEINDVLVMNMIFTAS